MKTFLKTILFASLTIGPLGLSAHGEDGTAAEVAHEGETRQSLCVDSRNRDQFPGFHPLVVHFPIVLLLLAPLAQLAGLILGNRTLKRTALLLALGGLAGAFIAANFVHPHAGHLPATTLIVLERHELFADLSLWFGALAALGASFEFFPGWRRTWIGWTAAGLMLAPAVFVSLAGHYGAELVHIHGVGPCGHYLEVGDHVH